MESDLAQHYKRLIAYANQADPAMQREAAEALANAAVKRNYKLFLQLLNAVDYNFFFNRYNLAFLMMK